MDKRILWGCIAALGAMMLFTLVTFVFSARLNQSLMTPLGELPLLDLSGVLVATALGGAIAGPRFRWIAVGLVVVLSALSLFAPLSTPHMTVSAVLKYNALALVLNLVLAWTGATFGPRLRERMQGRRTAH
ncbi:MAG TPA: hypothetical protein VGD42_00860 [Lysobacter sp.]